MNIIRQTSPYLRKPNARVDRMMLDVIIALLPIVIFAVYKFGFKALVIILASVLSMVLSEYLYYLFTDYVNEKKFKWKNESFTLLNGSALLSGLIYGLILPDSTPLYVVILGGVMGIFFSKLIFGGLGSNIFNPAGFARVFVSISFGTLVSYEVDSVAGATALQAVSNSLFDKTIIESFKLMDLFTGLNVPGSIGEVSAVLILLGGVYLFFRKSFDIRIPITYILTVLVLSSAVAIYKGLGIWYPMFHILSGGLLFGAIFMATDPVTAPVTAPGRIYYAFGIGFLTFIIRILGSLPEGVVFSILFMNIFVPTIDYYQWTNVKFTKKSIFIFSLVVIASIIITIVGVSQ